MADVYKLPLVLTPQPEGGYVVTSPLLPELITEGDTIADALENVKDALAAALEFYEDAGEQLPSSLRIDPASPVWFEELIASA